MWFGLDAYNRGVGQHLTAGFADFFGELLNKLPGPTHWIKVIEVKAKVTQRKESRGVFKEMLRYHADQRVIIGESP